MGRLTDYANQRMQEPPEESTGGIEWPIRRWLILQTQRLGANGAPTVRATPSGIEVFDLGFKIIGGEPDLEQRWKGRDTYRISLYLTEANSDKIAPKFVGFLNAVFATGVAADVKDQRERAKLRWQKTLQVLDEVAENLGVDPSEAPSFARAIAGLAVKALETDPRVILGTLTKNKAGFLNLGSFEDYTEENMKKRNVQLFFDPAEIGLDAGF